jgi:hypothetical protein
MIVTRVCWKQGPWLYGTMGYLPKTHERRPWDPHASVLSPPEVEIEYEFNVPYFTVHCLSGNKNPQLAGKTFYVPVTDASSWQMKNREGQDVFDMEHGWWSGEDPAPAPAPVTVAEEWVEEKTPPVEPYPKPAVDMTSAELQRASVQTKGKSDPNWKKRR